MSFRSQSDTKGRTGTPGMVNVGLVGLGAEWESRYLPALSKLRHRIAVRGVFDLVSSRAAQAAQSIEATHYEGLLALARHPALRALIVLDTSWPAEALVEAMLPSGKAIFLAHGLGTDAAAISSILTLAEQHGSTVVPALGRRYTPATARLKELIATCLGRPLEIEIEQPLPAPACGLISDAWTETVMGLSDWCRYVLGQSAVELQATCLPSGDETSPESAPAPQSGESPAAPAESCEVRLRYRTRSGASEAPTATIRIRPAAGCGESERSTGDAEASDTPAESAAGRFHLRCEGGEVEITGPTSIRWTAEGETHDEQLTADRSDIEVMFDHFCRRVVGGLLPMADLSDIQRGMLVVQATRESLATGEPVRINGATNGSRR